MAADQGASSIESAPFLTNPAASLLTMAFRVVMTLLGWWCRWTNALGCSAIRELLQAMGLLAGDSGNEIEVLIDVEDGEPRGFGCGGDQQVGDGRSAMLP